MTPRTSGLIARVAFLSFFKSSDDVIADIECFIEELEPYASPQLQDSVELVLDKIKDTSFVRELGLTVY